MSDEKINQMVLKVKNYLVNVLKYDTEDDELLNPYIFATNIRNPGKINIVKNVKGC